ARSTRAVRCTAVMRVTTIRHPDVVIRPAIEAPITAAGTTAAALTMTAITAATATGPATAAVTAMGAGILARQEREPVRSSGGQLAKQLAAGKVRALEPRSAAPSAVETDRELS